MIFLVNEKTNKRDRLVGFNLDKVDVSKFNIPDLFSRYKQRENVIRQAKQNVADREKESNGLIAKTSSNRGAESLSSLRLFFKFVQLTLNPKTMDLCYIFEERIIHAWTAYYSTHVSSASSAGNVAKYMTQFFGFLQTLDNFHGYTTRLTRLIEYLNRFRQQTKKQKEIQMASKSTEDALYILGQWLNEDELYQLNKKIYEQVLVLFKSDGEFLKPLNGENSSKSKVYNTNFLAVRGH